MPQGHYRIASYNSPKNYIGETNDENDFTDCRLARINEQRLCFLRLVFCAVNTHWNTQGLASNDNLRVDLRYSYAKADKFRSSSSEIATEAPSGSGEEIENLRTINQLLNLNVDYLLSTNWNIAIDLPVVLRDHTHTFDSVAPDAPFEQQAKFNELGDIRVLGKYRLKSEHRR